MVQNNKVLTVSYGTFSCTLEGFEESFETMKAIAEYFRDLAADDRYFGAEPPQPDADMLARIAEREVARQVEARREAGGIVLRASGPPSATTARILAAAETARTEAPAEPPYPAAQEPEEVAPIADTMLMASPADSTPPPVPAEETDAGQAAEAAPEADDTATADVLPDAADPVDAHPADAEMDAGPDAADESTEPAIQPETAAEEPHTADAEPVEDPADESGPAQVETAETDAAPAEDAIEPAMDLPPVMNLPVEEAGETADDPIVPAADSIAAKLQRIRAVVSQNEQAAADEAYEEVYDEEYAEDQSPAAFTADAVGDLNEAMEADDRAEAEQDSDDQEDDDQDDAGIAAMLERLERAEPDTAGTGAAPDADDASEPEAPTETGGIFDDLDAETDDLDDDDLTNIMGDSDDDSAEEGDRGDDAPEIAGQPDNRQHGDDRAPAAAPLARVVKIKRSDFEAAIAAGQLEEVADDGDEDQAEEAIAATVETTVEVKVEKAVSSSLSPAQEADLMRELAAVEAEFETVEPAKEQPGTDRARVALAATVAEDEDDLSRLMDAAQEKLSAPEAAASHETYSHLRAAVATTKAERSAGGTMGSHTDDDPYREDLASVVRPRRPETPHGRPQRPSTETRPAPLKLVAEQRVDDGAGAAARGPVRPRRISTQILDEPEQTGRPTPEGGFAEFAAEAGAVDLPDLLEAAAAYMTFVEGRAQFSRPQLMGKVRQVEPGDFNREDGLRSFGQLLRDGKIVKKGGGRFCASGGIGFRPDERAFG